MMRKSTDPLRSAFQFEVRPDVYAGRVWTTSMIAGIVIAAISCYHNGSMDINLVVPTEGWQPRDPGGTLYVDTWRGIVSDSLQVGFGLWGAELILRGIYRLAREFKMTPVAFSLGGAFAAFAYFVPNLSELATKLLVEHYPFLVG